MHDEVLGLGCDSPNDEHFENKPVIYKQIHNFRLNQIKEGVVKREDLSDAQLGLVYLDKCHHVSTTTSSVKDLLCSYRVRICKTCCQENGHIELGTYIDQESAILVNDAHEILHNRYDKLALLRKEDVDFLNNLNAKKFDRNRARECTPIIDLLSERVCVYDDVKRRKRGLSIDQLIEASYLSGDALDDNDEEYLSKASEHVNEEKHRKIKEDPADDSVRSTVSSVSVEIPGMDYVRALDECEFEAASPNTRDVARTLAVLSSSANKALPPCSLDTNAPSGSVHSINLKVETFASSNVDSPLCLTAVSVGATSTESPVTPMRNRDSKRSNVDRDDWFGRTANFSTSKGVSEIRGASGMGDTAGDVAVEPSGEDDDEESKPVWERSRAHKSRGATFSYSPFVQPDPMFSPSIDTSRIRTLTWLANMGEDEVSAAHLLSQLSGTEKTGMSALQSLVNAAESEGNVFNIRNSSNSSRPPLGHRGELAHSSNRRGRSHSLGAADSEDLDQNDGGGVDGLSSRAPSTSDSVDSGSLGEELSFLQDENKRGQPLTRQRSNSVPAFFNSGKGSMLSSSQSPQGGGQRKRIGAYTAEERRIRIERFLSKRNRRVWTKKVKYDVRKNFADSRIRVKGRFIRKEDEDLLKEMPLVAGLSANNNGISSHGNSPIHHGHHQNHHSSISSENSTYSSHSHDGVSIHATHNSSSASGTREGLRGVRPNYASY